jgi:hypothetical protein
VKQHSHNRLSGKKEKMETIDRNKLSSTSKSASEEKLQSTKLKRLKWKETTKGFAVSAGLTLLNGAMFALGSMAARSAVDSLKARRLPTTDSSNVVSLKRQVANA